MCTHPLPLYRTQKIKIMINYPAINKAKRIDMKKKGIINNYLDFCHRLNQFNIVLYIIGLLTITSIFIPIGVYFLQSSDWLLAYIITSMVLFLSNIVLHVDGQKTPVTLSFYLAIIGFHLIVILSQLL